jgi:hypothetical protein
MRGQFREFLHDRKLGVGSAVLVFGCLCLGPLVVYRVKDTEMVH